MNNDPKWQKDLDDFLANNPVSIDTRVLARSMVEDDEDVSDIETALHLEQNIDQLDLLPMPESLQDKLQNISNQQTSNIVAFKPKRNWLAIAALAASVSLVTVLNVDLFSISNNNLALNEQQPTVEEVAKAQQDLAIAFKYLAIAKTKSHNHIEQTIQGNVQRPIIKSLFQPLTKFKES